MNLNKSQLQAVCHDKGPMMVLAGPGSGKTMVITHRVKWLIEHAGVHPAGILVVTFTKAAADEMRQRFVSLMDGRPMPVSFGTFHAIFFSVLKHAYNYTASNIIREEQKQQLIREIIEDMPVEPDNVSEFVNDVLSEIGLVKGSIMPPAVPPLFSGIFISSMFRGWRTADSSTSRICWFIPGNFLPRERISLQPGSTSFSIF